MNKLSFKNEHFLFSAIFVIALSLRLVVAFSPTKLYSDDIDFNNMANWILEGKGYHDMGRHPGYPFFLAFIYFFTKSSVLAAKIVQAFLGASIAIIAYYIAKNIFKRIRFGLVSGLTVAFYPLFILYTGRLFSENLQIFLMALCLLFVFKNFDKRSLINEICIGILFGFSILTRAVVAPFLPVLLIWMLIFSEQTIKNRIRSSLIVTSFVVITLMPLVIRNYVVYKSFVLISTLGGENFYAGNTVQLSSPELKDTQKAIVAHWQEDEYLSGLPPAQRDQVLYKRAFSYIMQHPKEVIKLQFFKLARMWHLWSDDSKKVRVYSVPSSFPDLLFLNNEFFSWDGLVKVLKTLFHLCYNILFVGMFLSLFFCIKDRRQMLKAIFLFSFIWIVSFIIVFAYMGGVRYRLFLDPYVFILGWFGVFNIFLYTIKSLKDIYSSKA